MGFGVEHPFVKVHRTVIAEYQEEIFQRFGQEERLSTCVFILIHIRRDIVFIPNILCIYIIYNRLSKRIFSAFED